MKRLLIDIHENGEVKDGKKGYDAQVEVEDLNSVQAGTILGDAIVRMYNSQPDYKRDRFMVALLNKIVDIIE